jgi:hypothetical protein
MFTDLLKSKTTKPKSTKTKEEADKRVEELLEQLFTKSEDMSEDMSEEESAQVEESMSELDKGGAMPWRRKLQEAAKGLMTPTEEEANGAALKGSYEGEGEMMKAEEGEESMSEEEGEEMSEEKGDDRAAMLARVEAMLEGLSDEELSEFLASREVRKALAQSVFSAMSTAQLAEVMSPEEANGAITPVAVEEPAAEDMSEEG